MQEVPYHHSAKTKSRFSHNCHLSVCWCTE